MAIEITTKFICDRCGNSETYEEEKKRLPKFWVPFTVEPNTIHLCSDCSASLEAWLSEEGMTGVNLFLQIVPQVL